MNEINVSSDKLQELVDMGYEVKQKCYSSGEGSYWGIPSISGEEYTTWLNKCKIFIKETVKDQELYSEFAMVVETAKEGFVSQFDDVMGALKAFESYSFLNGEPKESDSKIDKVFISHSSRDIEYVNLLVQLLNDMGIKKSDENIFCSSLPGYDINYYQSAPCLNEMGAAWVTSKVYNSILTPNFDFRHLSGAIDASKISFSMDDSNGLDKFKDKIIELFELEDIDYKIWAGDKKKFIESIEKISSSEAATLNTQVKVERVTKKQDAIELQIRFINVSDKEIEFKYIDFELNDSLGKKLIIPVEDSYLDEFKMYRKENKVVKWQFVFDKESKYNPRRDNPDLTKIAFEIYS